MMALLHIAVTLLCLLSVGRSAPVTDCESLTKPIEIKGREQLLGTWTYVAESSDVDGANLLTKQFVDTVWGKLTAAEESDVIHIYQVQRIFEQCFAMRANMSLANNTVSMTKPFNSSDVLLKTSCPDCLVFFSKHNIGGSPHLGLQLLSKRKNISADELDEFKKQASCLNLTSPVVFSPEKGFCPDESSSQNPEAFDLNSLIASMDSGNSDALEKFFEKFMNSESLTDIFSRIMTSASEWVGGMEMLQ